MQMARPLGFRRAGKLKKRSSQSVDRNESPEGILAPVHLWKPCFMGLAPSGFLRGCSDGLCCFSWSSGSRERGCSLGAFMVYRPCRHIKPGSRILETVLSGSLRNGITKYASF